MAGLLIFCVYNVWLADSVGCSVESAPAYNKKSEVVTAILNLLLVSSDVYGEVSLVPECSHTYYIVGEVQNGQINCRADRV